MASPFLEKPTNRHIHSARIVDSAEGLASALVLTDTSSFVFDYITLLYAGLPIGNAWGSTYAARHRAIAKLS